MLDWELPQLFWLAPLPLLAFWLLPAAQPQLAALRVPFFNQLQQLQGDEPIQNKGWARWLHFIALLLFWWLLLLASAQPTWIGEPVELPVSGRDLLLAVDISQSMGEKDMQAANGHYISRIEAMKEVVGEFVKRRQGDRLGLILFGEHAYMQTPLTFDRETVNTQLQEALIGFAGTSTAIGDAIGLATKRLLERSTKEQGAIEDRILILLTDGTNTAGAVQPLEAAQVAADEKVKIYTIGMGAEMLRRPDLFGFTMRSFRNTGLDETKLKQIADLTGGQYFRARDPADLNRIYQLIDTLEPLPEQLSYRPQKQLFYWPLGLAMLLSLGATVAGLCRSWMRSHA